MLNTTTLPPISPPVTSPGSHPERVYENRFEAADSQFIVGYTGFKSKKAQEVAPSAETDGSLEPIVGYSGYYRGKRMGKLGRTEIHRSRLSSWDKASVSDILGVAPSDDDWEFSHSCSNCENFTVSDAATSWSSSEKLHRLQNANLGHFFQSVRHLLESRFKTCREARNSTKAVFFAIDHTQSGNLEQGQFLYALQRVGISIDPSTELWTDLCHLLRTNPLSATVSYGRFLNIVTPRT